MSDKIQAIRGMNDILPQDTPKWQALEATMRQVLSSYGYDEIRTPIVESTNLFKRSIGDFTDIVEKEMYTFTDLNGDSLTLRPEGTASTVRACIEHGLLHNQQQKLWYIGPMFRHEKPQKGRYRQFYQLGVEIYGFDGISIEAEMLLLCQRLWQKLDLLDDLVLEINSLGTIQERQSYIKLLTTYFQDHAYLLDEDSIRRLNRNPLRILDSKNPDMTEVINNAPKLIDHLNEESKNHFAQLCAVLENVGIGYRVNPTLVRGLDYYNQTVFEWTTNLLGSQSTVCAGGRYDLLVEHLGGKQTTAMGFALGMERLILLQEVKQKSLPSQRYPLIFFITTTDEARVIALQLAEKLRTQFADESVIVSHVSTGLKSQFKKADKSQAYLALIIGEEELEQNTIGIKFLRKDEPQQVISQNDLLQAVANIIQQIEE
ncbi:histidine--tRNA ligase [Legionella sp. W05-934-2]|uniref:histidine--tRNA ligase n=1 Tax=Legionella sp. W05-934-2 TaxID=1198649 RepID=UPI00346226F5